MNNNNKMKILVAAGLIVVALVALYFLVLKPKENFEAFNAKERIDRPDVGLEFSYVAGPNALSLFEPATLDEPVLAAFIMMPSGDFLKVRNQEAQDTPPSISIFVFDNPERDQVKLEAAASSTEDLSSANKLRLWAEKNDSFTGITTATSDIEEVTVDSLKGIKYSNEALYKQEIYLFSYRDRVYLFAGQYDNGGDGMRKYFEEILASVYFD